MAGTHDIPKGSHFLNRLVACRAGETVSLPPSSRSPTSTTPASEKTVPRSVPRADVILVQGWMLGHRPTTATSTSFAFNQGMSLINANLKRYKEWEQLFDALMVVSPKNVSYVKSWKDKEEKVKREQGNGMSEGQIREFWMLHLPCYELY